MHCTRNTRKPSSYWVLVPLLIVSIASAVESSCLNTTADWMLQGVQGITIMLTDCCVKLYESLVRGSLRLWRHLYVICLRTRRTPRVRQQRPPGHRGRVLAQRAAALLQAGVASKGDIDVCTYILVKSRSLHLKLDCLSAKPSLTVVSNRSCQ